MEGDFGRPKSFEMTTKSSTGFTLIMIESCFNLCMCDFGSLGIEWLGDGYGFGRRARSTGGVTFASRIACEKEVSKI